MPKVRMRQAPAPVARFRRLSASDSIDGTTASTGKPSKSDEFAIGSKRGVSELSPRSQQQTKKEPDDRSARADEHPQGSDRLIRNSRGVENAELFSHLPALQIRRNLCLLALREKILVRLLLRVVVPSQRDPFGLDAGYRFDP